MLNLVILYAVLPALLFLVLAFSMKNHTTKKIVGNGARYQFEMILFCLEQVENRVVRNSNFLTKD